MVVYCKTLNKTIKNKRTPSKKYKGNRECVVLLHNCKLGGMELEHALHHGVNMLRLGGCEPQPCF